MGPTKFMQGPLNECIDRKSGQILVNEFCQVTNKHPLTNIGQPAKQTVYNNIFSFGDVCLTPRNEPKCIISMYQYGSIVAGNIVKAASNLKNLEPMPIEFSKLQMVPIGP
jgi:NADH dehydrogenase FAD-containing subunit